MGQRTLPHFCLFAMNQMEKALRELTEMDDLAAQDSPIHRLSPAAKLLSTIAYIAVTVSFGKYRLSALVPMALWPVLLFQLSGVPVRLCFYKLRFVLPLVAAVGLFNPFLDRSPLLYLGSVPVSGGVISMVTLMLKGVLCLMASFLLMATTSIDCLCAALRGLRVPKLLVTLLLLTYRYAGLMTEELAIMTDAYHLRAPGQRGIHISAWGSFLGQLLLRSADRAGELYTGMLLRGYRDEFPYAQAKPFSAADAAYLLGSAALFVLFRSLDLGQLLGGMIVR